MAPPLLDAYARLVAVLLPQAEAEAQPAAGAGNTAGEHKHMIIPCLWSGRAQGIANDRA